MTQNDQNPSFRREAYQSFDSLNAVEDWLEPMEYENFWRETAKHALVLPSKVSIDARIAKGSISEETMLVVLKGRAVDQICERYNLTWVDLTPWRYG